MYSFALLGVVVVLFIGIVDGQATSVARTPSPTISAVFKDFIRGEAAKRGVMTFPPQVNQYLDTYQTCEVQPPVACFTAPRLCSNATIAALQRGELPGTDLTNCAQTTYKSACSGGYWLPESSNSSVENQRAEAYPCCPGYFCLPNQVCMVPCINGSICRTSSWYCDNAGDSTAVDRTCTPFAYRSQHEAFLIPQPPEDTARVLDPRQKTGLRCGGADELPTCPRGYYCPDTITMKPCEAGHFCREGSMEMRPCPILTRCGPLTSAPTANYIGVVVFFVILAACTLVYCIWKGATRLRAHRARKHLSKQQAQRAAHKPDEPVLADPFAHPDLPVDRNTVHEKVGLDRYQTIPAAVMEAALRGETSSRGSGRGSRRRRCNGGDEVAGATPANLAVRTQRMVCPFDKCSAATSIESRPPMPAPVDDDEPKVDRVTFSTYFYELSLHVGNKLVLNKASGLIQAGRLTAVMGASGSGKSSFLAALSGRARQYGTIDGTLFIKSSEDSAFRRGQLSDIEDYVAFVPQDDVMPVELTVENNVKYSAAYRLDRGSDVEKATARVLSALELSGVKHSEVGDAEKRGISGGERKRVNIAMELVANPSVLLLDEPTSGLDASAAIKVMRLMKRVARHGTAVVAVMHQPRREIFDLFDDVVLLAKGGHVAYMGPRKGCLPFFAAHFASQPLENQNPADFLLDLVTDSRPEQLERFGSVWRAHAKAVRPNISLRAKEEVQQKGRNRPWGIVQMFYCIKRCATQWLVNYPSELLYAVLFFLMGLLVGLLFQDVDVNEIPQPNFLLAFVLGLASIHYSLRTFGADQAVYWREASSGFNRFAYFMAKILFALWANVYLPLLMLLGFYSFAAPRADFGDYLLCVIVTYWFCSGLGFVVSLLWGPQRAQMVSVIFAAVLNVVSGFFPPIPTLEQMLSPTGAAIVLAPSYSRWLQEALFALEIQKLSPVFGFKVGAVAQYYGYCQKNNATDLTCSGVVGRSLAIIAGIGLLFRLITLFLLYARHRGAQNRDTFTHKFFSCFGAKHRAQDAVAAIEADRTVSERANLNNAGVSKKRVQIAEESPASHAPRRDSRRRSRPAIAAPVPDEPAELGADDDDEVDPEIKNAEEAAAAAAGQRRVAARHKREMSDLGKPTRDGRAAVPAAAASKAPATASLDEWVSLVNKATKEGKRGGNNERWFQAMYDCTAERDDELDFKRGDLMLLLDDSDKNWVSVCLWTDAGRSGSRVGKGDPNAPGTRVGLVPAQYITEVKNK